MQFDRKYLLWGFAYAIVGMLLGIVMAASGNHAQHVAHAHVLLVGFVISMIYAVIHRLWLNNLRSLLSRLQFALHHAGAVTMFTGLYLLYGNGSNPELLHPILGAASLSVLTGLVLMAVMVIRTR